MAADMSDMRIGELDNSKGLTVSLASPDWDFISVFSTYPDSCVNAISQTVPGTRQFT